MPKLLQEVGPFAHLHSDIRHLATVELPVRKACILTDRWISYPAAEEVLDRLFELLDMPPCASNWRATSFDPRPREGATPVAVSI